eukprot:scaffold113448_cov17-Tisochrysis_lutea.AAC.1
MWRRLPEQSLKVRLLEGLKLGKRLGLAWKQSWQLESIDSLKTTGSLRQQMPEVPGCCKCTAFFGCALGVQMSFCYVH